MDFLLPPKIHIKLTKQKEYQQVLHPTKPEQSFSLLENWNFLLTQRRSLKRLSEVSNYNREALIEPQTFLPQCDAPPYKYNHKTRSSMATGSGLFPFLGCGFVQIFGQIISIRVPTLMNTNAVAPRLIKRKKALLPVAARRSKTPLNFLCGNENVVSQTTVSPS